MTHKISLTQIGIIHTPHNDISNMPIQPSGAIGIEGYIELETEYLQGLTNLEGFSDLILIYNFHKVSNHELLVKPFMDDKLHGIFATRSPKRPSPIGISTVTLKRIEGNKIYFDGADMLNQTPLIDIKPFFRQTDNRPNAKSGWLDSKDDNLASKTKSDNRFE